MGRVLRKLMRALQIEFGLTWGIVILTFLLGEFDVIPNGLLEGDNKMLYYANIFTVLLTVVCVPLSLKLFSLNTRSSLRRMDKDEALQSYHVWSIVRLALLGLSAEVGIFFYFLFMHTNGILCTLIVLITLLFCTPSARKVRSYLVSNADEQLEDLSAESQGKGEQ